MLSLLERSLKSWNRERGVALMAVVALAIGIGSATAIFTVVDAVLLRPLPYSDSERWVSLLGGDTHDPKHFSGLSWVECEAYQRMRSFQEFGWFPVGGDFNVTTPGVNLNTPGLTRHINGLEVSPSLIASTGAAPAAGRFFSSSDGTGVAVVSFRLLKQLGPAVVGTTIRLNGEPYTVIGATPAWFRLPVVTVESRNSDNDVWIPLKAPKDEGQRRNYSPYQAYAKLKEGVSLEQARAEAVQVAAEIRSTIRPNEPNYTAGLQGLQETVAESIRGVLLLLFGAAGLLLLITCADVAALLVSRSVGRARETAIRIALGASRPQLALQYLMESMWVALPAALGGILVSVLLVRSVVRMAAEYIPRSSEVRTNWTVVAFAVALAVLCATLSALAPLWQAFRTAPNEVLTNGVRASAGVRSRKLSQILVLAEIALAFTLICSGGILLWEFHSLTDTSPGFNPNGLLTFQITRPNPQAFPDRLIGALQAFPGITGVAMSNQVPLEGCCFTTSLSPKDRASGTEVHDVVSLMLVSPDYFRTMEIPLQGGRLINEHDTNENLIPIVIDLALADRFWRNHHALGALANLSGSNAQVVGIVGTVKNEGLGKTPMPEVYLNSKLAPQQQMSFIVRSSLPAGSLVAVIRRAVAGIDPAQPIYSIESMQEIIAGSMIFERIEWTVVSLFALAALLMACLGVYGLTSYSVRQRTTEMGTRMALGATGNQLLQLITGSGLRLALYGISAGLVVVAAVTRLATVYFNVQHLNALPYLVSIAIMISVSVLASLVPAWRASLLSPMVAIRNDSETVWTSARRALDMARQRIVPLKEPAAFDGSLLSEFIESSRNADTFAQALQSSLVHLAAKLRARSAHLLEKTGEGEFHVVASEPQAGIMELSIPDNGFLLNRLRFYGSPMSFSSADLETSLRWADSQKPSQVDELRLLETVGLRLAVPLRTNQDLIGLLIFGEREDSDGYSTSDKNLVAACAEQFALTIENARLNKRVLEQEKIRGDIALATEVQRRLLPDASPQTPVTSFGAYTLAARSVGGDYYDFFQMRDHTIGIALADVAGKGVAAALIMAVVQASLRIIASEENISLPELAGKLNRFLHRSTGFSSYATFFYAQLDEQKHQLRYVNAGHNPPYLFRENEIEELATGGMIVGMFPAASYEDAVVDLHTGDLLLAFTDGVTEALNPAGEEFGEERLKDLVRGVAHLPISEITRSISERLREWIDDAVQHDDITFIVMKVNEPGATTPSATATSVL